MGDVLPILRFPHDFSPCEERFCPEHADRYCPICDGGFLVCSACGASEGELLVNCPGYRLSSEVLRACRDGQVVDLASRRLYVGQLGQPRSGLSARRERS